MITIPTTELIGCISAVLPITLDPKDNPLAGVAIRWDGDTLHFTTYDVHAGATVQWIPGEGAEGDYETEDGEPDIEWGGEDNAWQVFISHADAKEIVKLFKLPAKLWRYPVHIECAAAFSRLVIERQDGPRGERLLTIATDNSVLNSIPDVRSMAIPMGSTKPDGVSFNGLRLASLGPSTAYGQLDLVFGASGEPVGAIAGSRYAAFIYRTGQQPRRFSLLRDGAGVHVS